jgi:hypothetical protein
MYSRVLGSPGEIRNGYFEQWYVVYSLCEW